MMRESKIKRKTNETDISLSLSLGGGDVSISTGVGFLDHMLTLLASHAGFGLEIRCVGDIEVDFHHTTEDIGLALGAAFSEAVGDKRGIARYGDIILPMDESLVLAAADISGRGMLFYDVAFTCEKIGDFDTELVKEFYIAFARTAGVTLHIRMLAGQNSHHIAEAIFKASAYALRRAAALTGGGIPSTKGIL